MTKKFYITTTLPYVNANPHIGFALEIIQADVIARWKRQQGYDVFFNFGTDEHGVKIYRKAKEAGMEPKAYCDQYAATFNALKGVLRLTYNSFIRTTDSRHMSAAQEFWRRCEKNGDLYKKNYQIKYCYGCELEKTDSELENGRCLVHPNQDIELIEEENYFFRYSRYQKPLLDFYKRHRDFVVPESKLREMVAFTERGLEDFSVSRLKEKMPWGVPVPGDDRHVMYVWFDALVGYISALGWPDDEKTFKKFWPGMQIAGKDNLRQQSSMWQAMLLSAGLPNSKQVVIHGFITVDGQKMSKSIGNVVDPFELVKKYGVDVVRYYLLREISPTEDGDFTYEKFKQRYHADLAGGVGNLLSRTLTLALKPSFKKKEPSLKVKARTYLAKREVKKALRQFKFNEALREIWELFAFCDRYLNEEKPWEGKRNASRSVSDVLFVLRFSTDLLEPLLPETADKIREAIKSKGPVVMFPRLDTKKKL